MSTKNSSITLPKIYDDILIYLVEELHLFNSKSEVVQTSLKKEIGNEFKLLNFYQNTVLKKNKKH